MSDLPAQSAPAQGRPCRTGALVVLGLESSCDDTAAAVVVRQPDGAVEVRASVRRSQDADHAAYGGVVPEIAARAHAERLDDVIARAMADAGLSYAELDAVAATAGPGLIGGVMVGLMTGKAIAQAHDLPFLAINHLEGHVLSARLAERVAFPFLALLVSGGHSLLVLAEDLGRYRRLGATIDDAAGEAFDKTAKLLGLPHPGGPALEALAAGGDAGRFDLPRPLRGQAGCDFSFAGLKTAAARLVDRQRSADDKISAQDRADIAASFQAAVADVLVDRTAHALALKLEEPGERRPGALVVVGGVAANGEIRRRLTALAQAHGVALVAPPLAYCTDNGAMIALAGAERLAAGMTTDGLSASARPRWPLDARAAAESPSSGGGRKGPKA